jgi:hypothetical protein
VFETVEVPNDLAKESSAYFVFQEQSAALADYFTGTQRKVFPPLRLNTRLSPSAPSRFPSGIPATGRQLLVARSNTATSRSCP